MTNKVLEHIQSAKKMKKKSFAVLIDPDSINIKSIEKIVKNAIDQRVDYFFVGGSLLLDDRLKETINYIKSKSEIPVVLFPGDTYQINEKADALLFLSLISGRNPDLLIGKQVAAAPYIKKIGIETIPTGYMLIDGGRPTTASYMSNTFPIPKDKNGVAICTAMAGEMLGLQLIYMDAGSGAKSPISSDMIAAVAQNVDIPIIIGGGIQDAAKVKANFEAGADIVVIGNGIEKNTGLIEEVMQSIRSISA